MTHCATAALETCYIVDTSIQNNERKIIHLCAFCEKHDRNLIFCGNKDVFLNRLSIHT